MRRKSNLSFIFNNFIRKFFFGWLTGHLCLSLYDFLFQAAMAFFTASILSMFEKENPKVSMVIDYMIVFIIWILISMIVRMIGEFFYNYSVIKIKTSIKTKLVDKLMRVRTKEINKNNIGSIMSHINQDVDIACDVIGHQFQSVLRSIVAGGISIIIVFAVKWYMGIIGLVIVIFSIYFNIRYGIKYKNIGHRLQEKLGKVAEVFVNLITGNKDVKLYGLKNYIKEDLILATDDICDVEMDLAKLEVRRNIAINMVTNISANLPLLICCILVSMGYMNLFELGLIFQMINNSYSFTYGLGNAITSIQKGLSGVERVKATFEIRDEINYIGEKQPIISKMSNSERKPIISFKDLKVSYDNTIILHDISFNVYPNEKIAIVGPSGSGKSTILKCILQYIDYEGSISIMGHDVNQYSVEELRKNITYVPQENCLFDCSIYENILYGDMNADKKQVMKASKSAYVHEFIDKMSEGYDTKVGEYGYQISGGQRQRVALARVFLKNAPIILLDEATSALDNESELIVQKALNNLTREKTLLVVAHRLSTIKNVDRILVVNKGEIVETGTHDELMNDDTLYKRLYQLHYKMSTITDSHII